MSKRLEVKGNIIKETNYKKILQLICKEQEITKLDIAYTLKISIPTVTTNINELRDAGMIEEIESDIYTGGRKPKIVKLIPNARVSIGISVTKHKVSVVVLNLLSKVIFTKQERCEKNSFMAYIEVGKKLMDEAITQLGIQKENILGVGISIPGIIDESLEIAEKTNMGYSQISLNPIYEFFDQPVYIENEANLSLIAEKILGGYAHLDEMIYIGINEGLGGGIFVNNQLFKGVKGRAGEFGHMRIGVNKEGNEAKTVEDYISTKSLVESYNKEANDDIESFEAFEAKIIEKDEVAIQVLNQGIEVLCMMIYNLGMIFDIKKMIVGGKIGRLIHSQEALVKDQLTKYNVDMDVIFSNLRNTTTIGAALLPINDFYE